MAKLAILTLFFAAQLFAANAQTLIGGATSVSAVLLTVARQSPVRFTYAGIGSGGGRRNFISGSFLICASDNAFTPAEDVAYCAARSLPPPSPANAGHFTLPYIVLSFGVFASTNTILGTSPTMRTPLSMSAAQLATIYCDRACNWNVIYPGKNVPLVYFVRCDNSGTTKVFTTYLQNSGGSAWTLGSSFGSWPGLTACTTNPPPSAVYGKCGQPSIDSYNMALSLAGCVGTGCITYLQAGFGKGKGAGPGQTPIRLAEIAIPNRAGRRLTSSTCLISQAIPAISPTTRQSWFNFDNSLLNSAGASTCPIISLNYMNSRYLYGRNTAPKRVLTYLFGVGYKTPTFINLAVSPLPASLKAKSTSSIAVIR